MASFRMFGLSAALLGSVLLLDQSAAIRVLASGDGTLYLVQDSDAWTMQPTPIAAADLASLTPRGELDGAIPAPFLSTADLAPMQAVQAADGSVLGTWSLTPTGDTTRLQAPLPGSR